MEKNGSTSILTWSQTTLWTEQVCLIYAFTQSVYRHARSSIVNSLSINAVHGCFLAVNLNLGNGEQHISVYKETETESRFSLIYISIH